KAARWQNLRPRTRILYRRRHVRIDSRTACPETVERGKKDTVKTGRDPRSFRSGQASKLPRPRAPCPRLHTTAPLRTIRTGAAPGEAPTGGTARGRKAETATRTGSSNG